MSSTKHTPEPFPTGKIVAAKYGPKKYGIGVAGGEAFIMAQPCGYGTMAQLESDLDTILIRVNAMQGIDDPAAFRKCFDALVEASANSVPMMEMAWKQYGVGGMFECMDALRAALQSAKSLTTRGA